MFGGASSRIAASSSPSTSSASASSSSSSSSSSSAAATAAPAASAAAAASAEPRPRVMVMDAADEEGPRAREFQKRETPPNTPKGRRRTLGGGARAAASGVDSPRLPQAFSNPYQPQAQARCTTAMLTVVGALLLALSLLLFTAARHGGRGGPADEIDWLLGRGRAHGVAGLAETERQRVARAFFEAPSAAGDHVRRAMHAFHRADGGARYVGAGDDHVGGGGGGGGRGGAGGGGADLEDVDAAAAAAAAAGTWGAEGFEDGAANAGAEEIFIEREDGGQLLRGMGGSPREAGM